MKLQIRFVDNNGKKAQSQINLPASMGLQAAAIWGIAAANLMEELTDAYIPQFRIVREVPYAPARNTPSPGADVFNRLVLFFRNGQYHSFVRIPAASANLPYDIDGAYRGHRITSDSFLGSPVLAPTLALWQTAISPNGTPLAGEFIVGTRTRSGT